MRNKYLPTFINFTYLDHELTNTIYDVALVLKMVGKNGY